MERKGRAAKNENPSKNEGKTGIDKLESILALTAPTEIRSMVEQVTKQNERERQRIAASASYEYILI